MDNNEILEVVETAENVEQTTEETVVEPEKLFTQDDLNAAVGKAKARERAKITKQFEKKYGQLEEVLKAGTGKESVEEITDTFSQHYERKGIKMPKRGEFSTADIEYLAQRDAEEVIRGGFEDVVEEVDRLANIGVEHMTARDKAMFKVLAEHRQNTERGMELSQIGVTEDVYTSREFNDFASKFNSTIPIRDIYDIYEKTKKKDIKPMGSMKNTDSGDSGVKDYYSPEEARKFTKKDFDKNPALFKAVENSMLKWRK